MFVFLAVRWPFPLSFERNVALGKVDSDECNADGIASAAFESRFTPSPSPERDRLKESICCGKAKEFWIQVEQLHRSTNYAYTIADHAFGDRVAVKQ